jgi:hypothetical protein
MDDEPRTEPTPRPVTPAGDRGRIGLVVALVVGALLVGIARPWDLLIGNPRSPAPIEGPAAGASSTALPAPGKTVEPAASRDPLVPYPALWTTCGAPSGWRAATLQQWAGRSGPVRSWIAIDPVEATGPLDPSIPIAPVATDVVTAIGYCSPLLDETRPPENARASLWSLRGGLAVPLTATLLEPAEPSALGGLWSPASEVAVLRDGHEAWPPGRYVLRIRSDLGTFDRWLGIEIVDLGSRSAGASPSPGASSSPPAPGPSPDASAAASSAQP